MKVHITSRQSAPHFSFCGRRLTQASNLPFVRPLVASALLNCEDVCATCKRLAEFPVTEDMLLKEAEAA